MTSLSHIAAANEKAVRKKLKREPAFSGASLARKRASHPYHGFIEIDVPDVAPFCMFTNNDDIVALRIFWNGCHEPMSCCLWTVLAEENEDATFDIGAYTGLFSLLAATVNPKTRIVGFEPIHGNYSRMLINVRANQLHDSISVRNEAVGAEDGCAEIAIFRNDDLLPTGSSMAHPREADRLSSVGVVVRSLDSISHELGVSRVGLVKIDAEHLELAVLRGMQGRLSRDRPDVLVEVSNANYVLVSSFMKEVSADYQIVQIDDENGEVRFDATRRLAGCRNVLFTARKRDKLNLSLERAVERCGRYLAAGGA